MPLTPPSSVSPTLAQITAAFVGEIMPQGALAETVARAQVNGGTSTLLAQRLALSGIRLAAGVTYTSISYVSGGTALAVGAHQLFGIYDDSLGSSSGTARALLAGTADDTSTAWGASTVKTLALTTPYTPTRSGLFYIGILIDAGTMPTLYANSGGNGVISTIPPILCGTSSTGVTALPNPAGAISATGTVHYAFLL